jgi:hypothetical protein
VVDRICGMLVREGVTHVNVREILRVPKIYTIWSSLPHDIISLMCHVVNFINLI